MDSKWLMVAIGVTAAASRADGSHLDARRIFIDDGGNAIPAELGVFRVYWIADDPGDRLVGVVGSPTNPFRVVLDSGQTFFDSSHFAASDRPPALGLLGLPGFEELSYDSWFTVGNTSAEVGPAWPSGAPFSDEVIVAPGTAFDAGGTDEWEGGPGGPDNVAWTVPPTLEDPGGGGVVQTPQTLAGNWPDDQIVIMQITVVGDFLYNGAGNVGLLVIEDGVAFETSESFKLDIPAPPALALLAAAGLASGRRRR